MTTTVTWTTGKGNAVAVNVADGQIGAWTMDGETIGSGTPTTWGPGRKMIGSVEVRAEMGRLMVSAANWQRIADACAATTPAAVLAQRATMAEVSAHQDRMARVMARD